MFIFLRSKRRVLRTVKQKFLLCSGIERERLLRRVKRTCRVVPWSILCERMQADKIGNRKRRGNNAQRGKNQVRHRKRVPYKQKKSPEGDFFVYPFAEQKRRSVADEVKSFIVYEGKARRTKTDAKASVFVLNLL